MNWVLMIIAIYLTYYTYLYAKMVWQGGNKLASIFLLLLSGGFVPLSIFLNFFK